MEITKHIKMTGFIAGLLFFSACDQALNYGDSDKSKEFPYSDDVAFIIDGEPVLHFDIRSAAIAEGIIREGEAFDSSHREYAGVVDRLMDRVVLAQAAETFNLMDSPRAQRQLYIARRQVLARLYLENRIATRVTESAILDMFEVQVKLQQVDDSMRYTRIVLENEESALTAREQILMGKSFYDVASEYSIESSWKRRNDAEKFVKPNRIRAPYPQILSETPVGGVSEPFATNEGWIIVKVEERLGKAPARLDELRQEITEYLKHTTVENVISSKRKRAVIVYPSQTQQEGGDSDSKKQVSAE